MSGGGQATVLEVIADLQPVWGNDPPFGVAERCMHAFYLDGRSFVHVFRPRTRLRPSTFYQRVFYNQFQVIRKRLGTRLGGGLEWWRASYRLRL